jgi:hypothetical protein
MLANVLDIVGLLELIEVAPDLFDAAPGWPNNAIIVLEISDKQALGRGGIDFVATVGHGLSAAGLVERVSTSRPNRSSSSKVAIPTSG